jgi:methyl-accepting chemotaxis protein
VVGDQSTAALTYNDKTTAKENLASVVLKKHGIIAAALYTPDKLFVSYSADGGKQLTLPAKPQLNGWKFTNDQLSGFQHIFLNDEDIGAIYICSDLTTLHWMMWRNGLTILLFTFGSLLLAWLLASRLQRIISRPVSHLAETAGIVSLEKNYAIRARKESDDELGRLIDGFNGMLEEIQRRDDALTLAKNELEERVQERTQDLQQQFQRISLLNQITYAVAERQDFESIIQVVLQQLEEHLPVDYSSTYKFDRAMGVCQVIRRGPKSHAIVKALGIPDVMPLDHTIFRTCLER